MGDNKSRLSRCDECEAQTGAASRHIHHHHHLAEHNVDDCGDPEPPENKLSVDAFPYWEEKQKKFDWMIRSQEGVKEGAKNKIETVEYNVYHSSLGGDSWVCSHRRP